MHKLRGLPTIRMELETERESLDQQSKSLLSEIERACEDMDEDRAMSTLHQLFAISRLNKTIHDLLAFLRKERRVPTYATSSWFLYDCYEYLMRKEPEDMFFVTGLRMDNLLTLDRIVPFTIEKQTSVYVKGQNISSHKVLIQMDEDYGHKLHGWFHSHPGRGAGATHPSGTDRNHQERLERGGYPVIGAIFVNDGFIRLFSLEREFETVVYGKGVEKIDDRLYRLSQVGKVHNPRNQAQR